MSVTTGTRLGPHEIIAAIGAGGMGEVFRARDSRLSRDVAIKVLPAAFARDVERVARFRREAQVLATLNHPNIAAIYGLEESGDLLALVLELAEGEDLAARLRRGPIPLREAVAIARQIALGIGEAHDKGIVHRDLKPANIKLTPDGKVKILDFGLAKAWEAEAPPVLPADALSAATTQAAPLTEVGIVHGTPAYMSPEQARGTTLDQRSDIWAFGCILYEMLTGRRAFSGSTSSDIIAKVLEHDPDWTALPPGTPTSLQKTLRRCLEKDVKQRLRHIGDAVLEADVTAEGALVPAAPRRRALRSLVGAVAALSLLWMGWFAGHRSSPAPPPAFDRVVRLVSTAAHEFGPAISPDGKWVAYLSNARGPTDVWVKFLAGGDPVNLTASAGVDVQSQDPINGLEVSPDGTQIAFQAGAGQAGAAWVIPAPLGGVPRKVLPSGNSGLRWSPDGKRIAYIRTGGPLGDALIVSDADGQNEREIAKREGARHIHWVRWSPDGRFVYFNHGPQNFNTEPTEIWRVASTGGPMETVISTARRAAFPVLSPDGRNLIYAANHDTVDLSLWTRDLTTGRDHRLTSGVGDYSEPSLSADGARLVGTVTEVRQSLARVALSFDRAVTLEPLTDGFSGDFDPAWSPDGSRLVWSSSRTGNRTLWFARDGLARPAPLTSDAAFDERPAYSPDGQQIAFVSDRGGHRGIWVVSAEGGRPRFIAPADVVDTISWSPDGRRLVYATPAGDAPGLRIMTVADGTTTRLPTKAAAVGPAWSPREDVIAFIEPRGGSLGAYVQLIRPDGSQPTNPRPLDGPDAPWIGNGFVAWSPDGKRLAAASLPGALAGSIWIVEPASPTPYRKLMDLPAGVFLRGVTWARDGASLILGRVQWTGDIFLAEKTVRR